MTNHSIISTKIILPRLRPDVVIRPPLLEMLNEGRARPAALTLISAPAGYGKTTTLLSWLYEIQATCAWLSLDSEDDSFPRFVNYVVASLERSCSAIGLMMDTKFEEAESASAQVDSILSCLINRLSRLGKPALLVLEDYHCIQSRDIHKFVSGLVEHGNPCLHLVLTTRHDPPLPFARWRGRHQLLEIRTADLKFTLEETREFLKRVMKLELPESDLSVLDQRMEGWAAGLQLAALSVRDRNNDAWESLGKDRHIREYLMTEVFDRLPLVQQEFLMQTSLVKRINAELGHVLTGQKDSQRILETLEDDNLFTTAYDTIREWFSYHQLFAEFLQQRLLGEYSEMAVRELHRRASHWLGRHGFAIEAIDHALAAQEYEFAACLIPPQCDRWMRYGEISSILKYLDQLPRELAWNQWNLCLWYGWTYAVKGNLQPAETWTDRLEILLATLFQDPEVLKTDTIPNELQNAYVQVLGIRSVIARQKQDFVSAIALGEQALRLAPEDNLNLQVILSAVLSSATLEAGNFDQAESVLQSARQMAYRVGNPYITFTILLNTASLAMTHGQLHRAYTLLQEADQLAQTKRLTNLHVLSQLRLGQIRYAWHQLSQARESVTGAIAGANLSAYPVPTIQSYVTLSLIQNAEGQYEQALETLADAERIALEHLIIEVADSVKAVRAQLQLLAGDHDAVLHWLQASDWASFDPSARGPGYNDESFFVLCQYLIVSGQSKEWDRVQHLLEWRLADPEQQNRGATGLRIDLLQALLAHTRNQPESAMSALLRALEIAVPNEYIAPFLMEGRALLPYLRRLPREDSRRNFAQKILACSASHPSQVNLNREALSEQEIKILQLIARGYTNPEIARQLVLAVSTVRWYVKQIFRKMGVHNRTQAAHQARQLSLL